MPDQEFDVLIIGGGMAGLTAGIYASRYGLNTAIVEQMMAGAQIINLEKIENFPGFPQGIAGYELGPATQEQAMNAGVEVLMDTATNVSVDGDYLRVTGDMGGSYRGKAVIMAAGSSLRSLGIPGEEEFEGTGRISLRNLRRAAVYGSDRGCGGRRRFSCRRGAHPY